MSKKNNKNSPSKTTEIQQSFFDNQIGGESEKETNVVAIENRNLNQVFNDDIDESFSDDEQELAYSFEGFPAANAKLGVFERILNRVERLVVVLYHRVFDEVEAAMYLRLPDPETRGRETIRNYALRSKKLSYYKIGRNGLTFLKADLDLALDRFKVHSFRDL